MVKYYKENKNNYFLAIISGLSFSLAILARQPIIVLWLALPFLFIKQGYLFKFDFEKKEFFKFSVVTLFTSLLLPFYIFYVWGNIIPVSQTTTGVGISYTNLVLAFSYAAIFTLFIKPNYFKFINGSTNRHEFVTVIVISVLLNIFFLKIEFSPFNSIISNWLNPSFLTYYKIGCGSILGFIGLSFIYYFYKKESSTKRSFDLILCIWVFTYNWYLIESYSSVFGTICSTSISNNSNSITCKRRKD